MFFLAITPLPCNANRVFSGYYLNRMLIEGAPGIKATHPIV